LPQRIPDEALLRVATEAQLRLHERNALCGHRALWPREMSALDNEFTEAQQVGTGSRIATLRDAEISRGQFQIRDLPSGSAFVVPYHAVVERRVERAVVDECQQFSR
jgi:hypothetical protein